MDLSKAFDTMSYDLLISKWEGYRLFDTASMYIKSYFNNRKQSVNANNTFSSWISIIARVTPGSISGPLLFNIFLNDLFLFV